MSPPTSPSPQKKGSFGQRFGLLNLILYPVNIFRISIYVMAEQKDPPPHLSLRLTKYGVPNFAAPMPYLGGCRSRIDHISSR